MQQQHATTTTTTDHADMTSTARCSNHCNLREAGPTIHPTNLALTQVAVIAASCCAGHICMVGGGGGCCMLLLHPVPTSADAGCDLCTLCPDLCTLHPDLWILCLWCFPSFNWCKHSTCTGGGCHHSQLALMVLFHSATSADSLLAHMVASPSATCAGGAFSSIHWRKYCTCARATCTVWWWSVVVVRSCMWRWRYIHMKPALTLEQLALCGGNPQC